MRGPRLVTGGALPPPGGGLCLCQTASQPGGGMDLTAAYDKGTLSISTSKLTLGRVELRMDQGDMHETLGDMPRHWGPSMA